MSAVPELKQKKIARDAANAKAAVVAAAQAIKDDAELTKTIYAKAETYEAEYEAVSTLSITFEICHKCVVYFHSSPELPSTTAETPRPITRSSLLLRRSWSSLSVSAVSSESLLR
jgi:hypothetical protein